MQNVLTNILSLGKRTDLKLGEAYSFFISYNIKFLGFIYWMVLDLFFVALQWNDLFSYADIKGHTKKLTFFLQLQQVNIQLFHSQKFQPLKCYSEQTCLERSRKSYFGGRHFETVLGSQAVFLTSYMYCPIWKWQEGENPAADFTSFTRSANCIFF